MEIANKNDKAHKKITDYFIKIKKIIIKIYQNENINE